MSDDIAPETTENGSINEAVFEKLKECTIDTLKVDAEKVTLNAHLSEDLGADSLDLVEFVMELQAIFEIEIDESELDGVETIQHAYDLVVAKLS